MAITLVGTSSGNATGTSSLSITLPGGVQEGDCCVAWATFSGTSDRDMTENSGLWTELFDQYNSTGSRPRNYGAFLSIQGSTPDTAVQINASGAAANWAGVLAVYRGVDPTNPQDVALVSILVGGAAAVDLSSLTTVTDGCQFVTFAGGASFPATTPSGYGNAISDTVSSGGTGAVAHFADKAQATAGLEDIGTWGSTGGLGAGGALILALRPDAGSSGISGTLNVTLGALTSVGSSKLTLRGLVTKALGGLTSVGTSIIKLGGQVNKTLGGLTSAALSKLGLKAQTSVTLGALTLVATGVHGTVEEPEYDPEDDLPRWQMRNATNRRIRRM